jgi:apolipoprotein N-acyltransferase
MAILRSVENRVTLFRAAYTGVSLIVDPVGRVEQRLGPFTEGMIYGSAERGSGLTIYTKHGSVVYFLLAALNLALVCVPLLASRPRGAGPRA